MKTVNKPKLVIKGRKITLTPAIQREIVKAMRKEREPQPENLMHRLFNIDTKESLRVDRPLGNAEINQSIIHIKQPKVKGVGSRGCGIPVTVKLPNLGDGISVETRLVPQWRFGWGFRGAILKEAMRGKTKMSMREEDGKLVLTFK